MGKPCYPLWLDNLADDVTGEGAAWDGAFQGAETVRSVVVGARELYEHQEFRYAGLCGDYGFLEDYTTEVRGVHLKVVVTVIFNEAGQAQHLVVNHRPMQRGRQLRQWQRIPSTVIVPGKRVWRGSSTWSGRGRRQHRGRNPG